MMNGPNSWTVSAPALGEAADHYGVGILDRELHPMWDSKGVTTLQLDVTICS
jgi:hypothetical protein